MRGYSRMIKVNNKLIVSFTGTINRCTSAKIIGVPASVTAYTTFAAVDIVCAPRNTGGSY